MDKKIATIIMYAKPRLLHFTDFNNDGEINVTRGLTTQVYKGSDIVTDGPSKYLSIGECSSSEIVEVTFLNSEFTPILSEETIIQVDYIFPELPSLDYLLFGNPYLEKINSDIFENNKMHKKVVGLFMNCPKFSIYDNRECLKNMSLVENIDLTFSDTGIYILNSDVMKYLPNVKSMKRTFEGCENLNNIFTDTFKFNKNLEILHTTFSRCFQIKHVDMDVFRDMDKLKEFIDVFVNCDIRVVNPNFYCVLSYKTAYNNVFRGSKVKILDYE